MGVERLGPFVRSKCDRSTCEMFLPLCNSRRDTSSVHRGQGLDGVVVMGDNSNFSDRFHSDIDPFDTGGKRLSGRRV